MICYRLKLLDMLQHFIEVLQNVLIGLLLCLCLLIKIINSFFYIRKSLLVYFNGLTHLVVLVLKILDGLLELSVHEQLSIGDFSIYLGDDLFHLPDFRLIFDSLVIKLHFKFFQACFDVIEQQINIILELIYLVLRKYLQLMKLQENRTPFGLH